MVEVVKTVCEGTSTVVEIMKTVCEGTSTAMEIVKTVCEGTSTAVEVVKTVCKDTSTGFGGLPKAVGGPPKRFVRVPRPVNRPFSPRREQYTMGNG